MVWTAILRNVSQENSGIFSIIFESEHDPTAAYKDFLRRNPQPFDADSNVEVVVLIPGRHTSMYFPKDLAG